MNRRVHEAGKKRTNWVPAPGFVCPECGTTMLTYRLDQRGHDHHYGCPVAADELLEKVECGTPMKHVRYCVYRRDQLEVMGCVISISSEKATDSCSACKPSR